MKDSAKVVQQKLLDFGFSNEVVELPDSTRTAQEAANAIGCEVGQIAKSIIFKLESSEVALLVVASGINRIDETKIEAIVGEKIGKADAKFVKMQTGFVIGGVAPIGHERELVILVDEDLLQYKTIWAAAGHPKAVFQLTPDELVKLTNGKVVAVN